ncbi:MULTISPECIES: hypothetical protein [unclassified Peribacillus]|nr:MULTISPECIES: hypothetical protein [unclassified Peribacillus]MBK5444724.1 hypothetical protein [Peribacillus sp. TH24]MBK5482362.1 hypothetical protein [Peribacillus sp. TH16]MBK5498726.1 hypothetical protein [Peribacillus sp. TH14]WMX56164.1 hypothetical protein RE409_02600 [Peribacillus sp. R9-11]
MRLIHCFVWIHGLVNGIAVVLAARESAYKSGRKTVYSIKVVINPLQID